LVMSPQATLVSISAADLWTAITKRLLGSTGRSTCSLVDVPLTTSVRGVSLVNRELKVDVPEHCGTPPSLDIRRLRFVRASAELDRHIQRAIVIRLQRRRPRLSRDRTPLKGRLGPPSWFA
jgi:hypothetical protein